jgi:hypothetical protein
VSHNLRRRHLDETQRGVVGAKIADLPHGGGQYSNKNDPSIEGSKKPKTRDEVAKMMNVGHATIDRAKRAPRIEEYSGDDPLGFVISHNLHRRHMNESQRGMVGAKLANLGKGRGIGSPQNQ